MHKPYHIKLCRAALEESFSPAALEAIIQANLRQDSLLNLLKSEYHFDANAFEKAFIYTREQENRVLGSMRRGDVPDARRAFGRLTHALQDYYAHTNYAALWLEANPGHRLDQDGPVDPVNPEITGSSRLVAARVYYPLEALTVFPGLVPALQRRLPPDSHANMNLDYPGRGPLFEFAMSAALQRTILCSESIRERIEKEIGIEAAGMFRGDPGTGSWQRGQEKA